MRGGDVGCGGGTVSVSSGFPRRFIGCEERKREAEGGEGGFPRNMAETEEAFPVLPITSPETLKACASLATRSSDVFVASYPKSGTTWMQHIVHTLVTNDDSPLSVRAAHPNM